MDGLHLDGNALAGPLSRLFAPEMTSATVRCGACGLAGPLAAARLYAHAPGNVLRCRGCGTAVLRLIVADDRIHLDMPMGTALTVPVPPAGA
ncbi:hypothetical protein F7P10_11980 [Actinomadura sp. WMMB 499]|nr:hypothetical protein F7P10_11980 [Actinomadura sp. WMMB 499]